MRRIILALPLLLLASAAFAQKQTYKVRFFGADAGTSTYEQKPNGDFAAKVDVTVAGQKIDIDASGRIEKDKLVRYRLGATQAGQRVEMVVEDGKAKVTVEGKTTELEVKGLPMPCMGNFFPSLTSTMLAAYDKSKGGKQKISALLIDSGTVVQPEIESQGSRKFGDKTLEAWTLSLGGVQVTFVRDPKSALIVGMDVPAQSYQQVMVGYEDIFVDPTTLDPTLSQPTHSVETEKAVKMPMRDGVELVAEIARPSGEGKFPTILVRTPYGRIAQFAGVKAEWWARRGYAVVVQDCRGREDSGGEWDPFVNEKSDGFDTIAWIAAQPWCDGNVGMIGGSYSGLVQWQAAIMKPPALKCIIPQVSPPDAFFNIPYDHGVFFLYGNLWWANLVRDKKTHLERASVRPNWDKFSTLPLTEADKALFDVEIPFYRSWLTKERADDWAGWNYQAQMKEVTVPALHISGWWDGDGIGTKMNWAIMAAAGRTNQWLIYGPWSHAFNTSTQLGDMDYGAGAVLELDSLYLRWFDTWLKGKDAKLAEKVPRVQVFVTGANEWRGFGAWPEPSWATKTLYFSAQGPANGDTSKGELVDKPPAEQAPDRFLFNPADTTIPDSVKNVDPQAVTTKVEIDPADEGVLVYKSAPLAEPLVGAGPIQADIFFSTTAEDCDLFVTFLDVAPDGTMRAVGMPGKIRARYLSGWSSPTALEAGKVYMATIDLWDTAHQFDKGHRIGVAVQGGMYPLMSRNLGYFEPIATATRMVAQVQTVYHDVERPSCIRFRVIPPK